MLAADDTPGQSSNTEARLTTLPVWQRNLPLKLINSTPGTSGKNCKHWFFKNFTTLGLTFFNGQKAPPVLKWIPGQFSTSVNILCYNRKSQEIEIDRTIIILFTLNIYTFTLYKNIIHFYVKGVDSAVVRWWKFLMFIESFIHLE